MAEVIIAVPHAGITLPQELAGRVLSHVDSEFLLSQSDMFTDQVYSVSGVDTVVFGWSRLVVDPNRFEGQTTEGGIVPVVDFNALPIYREGEDPNVEEGLGLIERLHRPYHAVLADRIEAGDYRFFIDGHSMMAAAPRRSPDFGIPRPDACISNCGDERGDVIDGGWPLVCSAELTLFACDRLQHWLTALPAPDLGPQRAVSGTVGMNTPFKGGHGVRTHARPEGGMPGIQLELNQRLWVDEVGGQPLPGRIEWIRTVLERFVADMVVAVGSSEAA